MKRKKLIAVLAAAAMTVSTGAAGVSASTAYQDAEKAALAEAAADLTEHYSTELSEYREQIAAPSGADITFALDDAGKAILGALVPVDISWLNDLQVSADVSMTDGQLAESMDVNLNGTKILTMEVFMDYETWDTYVRIPELSEAYLKTNALDAMETAESDLDGAADSIFSVTSSVENPEFMQAYMNAVTNLEEYLPTAEEFGTLLDRYGNLIIDAFGEDETESGSETLTIGDVSVDCTVLEGTMNQTEAQTAVRSVIAAAKDDAEIKSLIEKWAALDTSGELTYEAYQSKIDELLAEIDESIADSQEESDAQTSDDFVSSKIWTDSEGTIVGRQIIFYGLGTPDITLTWQAPSTDSSSALLIQYSDGENSYELSGTGTLNGDLLSGIYVLSGNGADLAAVTVKDYDTAQMEEGNWNGTYDISLLDGIGEDAYASLGSFGLTAAASGGKTDGSLALTLTGSGVPYCSITVAAREGNAVEFPNVIGLGTVYDTANDEDMSAYAATVSTDTLFANLTAAGMPDGFIEDLMAAFSGESTEDETYYYDESEIIGGADETTEIYLEETTAADAAA